MKKKIEFTKDDWGSVLQDGPFKRSSILKQLLDSDLVDDAFLQHEDATDLWWTLNSVDHDAERLLAYHSKINKDFILRVMKILEEDFEAPDRAHNDSSFHSYKIFKKALQDRFLLSGCAKAVLEAIEDL